MAEPRRTRGARPAARKMTGAKASKGRKKRPRASSQALRERIGELERELAAVRARDKELQVDEARWRSLAEQSPLGIIAYRPDGTVKYANRALMGLFELTPEENELLVAHYNVLEDPRLRDNGSLEHIQRAFAGEVSVLPPVLYERQSPIENRPVRRWLEGLMYPVRDAEGVIREVVLIHKDMTPLRTAEEDVRESRDQLRKQLAELEHLYATAPVGLCLVDQDLRYMRINKMMAAINGRPTSDHLGQTIREVLPDLADDVERAYRRVIETGEASLDVEVHGVTAAEPGTEKDWLVSYHPLRSEDGAVHAVSAVVQDITTRTRAEAALRESEERFRELAEGIREVFWLFDWKQGRVTYASPAFETIWGRSIDNLYRDYGEWSRSVHPEDQASAADSFARIADSGGGEAREYRILRPDGEVRWISDRGFAVRDEAGDVVRIAGIAEDVTERKRQEEEHRHFESRVQHAQKLESLGVLAGGIAHDFNNLLMGILGNADVALVKLPPESPGREALERIKVASTRAAELTNQMLAYSGRTSFQAEPLDLNRIVEEMTHLLRAVISKKARLRLELAPELPPIQADAAQVGQVVMNLMTNASDALGDEDGVIHVTTRFLEADSDSLARCDVGERLAPGPYVSLEVADTGGGMNEATRQRMFDPFFTTKFTGRGLGLAAVLGIVRGHNAAMRVESTLGHGTRFTVLFPTAVAQPGVVPAEPAPELEPELAPRPGEGATILVVDDEPAVREVATNLLEDAGYRVLLAADGAEGVSVLQEHGRGIDLVLLDMTMPGLSGDEALEEMCRVAPAVRVLLSSGYTRPDISGRFPAENLAGFIQKPYGVDELILKISAALARPRS